MPFSLPMNTYARAEVNVPNVIQHEMQSVLRNHGMAVTMNKADVSILTAAFCVAVVWEDWGKNL